MPTPLASVVPAVAGWSASSLPRVVDTGLVAALLASCRRDTAVGRRDYAVLVLLSRLGLRGQEVADLELDDVDWRAGEVVIRGKGNRRDRLPLPVDVGAALADYLRFGRPDCSSRRVFVSARAPRRAITAAAVRSIVHHACDRAGVGRLGAHRLRHTVASEMLRRGAPLVEVGQILRHHRLSTTGIYAKVDLTALCALARPWPGAGA